MKYILRFIFGSMLFLLIQGCATHSKFVQKYNAWVGHNISELIHQIGYPDDTFTLPNKNRVYIYERSRIYSLPSPVMGIGYGFGGFYGNYGLFGYGSDIVQESCKLFIETTKKGIITKWASRGNHCVSN